LLEVAVSEQTGNALVKLAFSPFLAIIIVYFFTKAATCLKFSDCQPLPLNGFVIFMEETFIYVLNCIQQKDFDCNDAEWCAPKL